MFNKVALLAFVAPLVSALTLNIPQGITSDGVTTITWTATTTDNPFSLFLVNDAFHDTFGIANNVDPSLQTLTLTIPTVPARDGYALRATNPGNITDVFSETGTFSVGASTQTSTSASSTSASGSSAASGSSIVSGSGSTTVAATTTRPAGSSSTFGVTVSNSNSASAGSSAASGSSSSASSASASAFNSGAVQIGYSKAAAGAALLSLIAGAAFLGF